MICEKCKQEHDGSYGSGRFCNQTCARSFAAHSCDLIKRNEKISKSLMGRSTAHIVASRTNVDECPLCERLKRLNLKTCNRIECRKAWIKSRLKGKNGGPRPGGGRGKQTPYGGVIWDSTWEAEMAMRLDELKVEWVRPERIHFSVPYVYDGDVFRYYPDFWLPTIGIFLEVKGYLTDRAIKKIEACLLAGYPILLIESLDEIRMFALPTWCNGKHN